MLFLKVLRQFVCILRCYVKSRVILCKLLSQEKEMVPVIVLYSQEAVNLVIWSETVEVRTLCDSGNHENQTADGLNFRGVIIFVFYI